MTYSKILGVNNNWNIFNIHERYIELNKNIRWSNISRITYYTLTKYNLGTLNLTTNSFEMVLNNYLAFITIVRIV